MRLRGVEPPAQRGKEPLSLQQPSAAFSPQQGLVVIGR